MGLFGDYLIFLPERVSATFGYNGNLVSFSFHYPSIGNTRVFGKEVASLAIANKGHITLCASWVSPHHNQIPIEREESFPRQLLHHYLRGWVQGEEERVLELVVH